MSRLNCTARIAIVVVTAFILAAPAPGLAARQPEGKISRTGAWELVWSFHHLILDGWSLLLLLREVLAGYAELCQGRQPVAVKAVPFKDFITWQGRQDGAAAACFCRIASTRALIVWARCSAAASVESQ